MKTRWLKFVLCLGGSLACADASVFAEETGLEKRLALTDRVRAIIELVMENHSSPPTRQEMIRDVMLSFEPDNQRLTNRQVTQAVSEAPNTESLYQILDEHLRQCKEALHGDEEQLVEQAVAALNTSVLGGIVLAHASDVRAEHQIAANRYVGIGVQVGTDDSGNLVFNKVIEGGTAEGAGVLDGDVLESVEGEKLQGQSLQDVIYKLRGEQGTSLTIAVRTKEEPVREVTMTRAAIPLKTMRVEKANERTLMVSVERIAASFQHELQQILAAQPDTIDTLILDMRMATATDLHHLKLMADSLADESEFGQALTSNRTETIRTENGTILGSARLVLLYQPYIDESVDWLVEGFSKQGVRVFHQTDSADRGKGLAVVRFRGQRLSQFFPLPNAEYYIQFNTIGLFHNNQQWPFKREPVGVRLEPEQPVFDRIDKEVH